MCGLEPDLPGLAKQGLLSRPQSLEFYPPAHGERRDEKQHREQRAKAICRTCPVNTECLDFAIGGRELHGIWGGTTEVERRGLIGLSV